MKGMTNQNIAAESARENARQTDGKFGTQPKSEAEIDLDAGSAPAPAPSQVVDGDQITHEGLTTYLTHTEVDGAEWHHQVSVTEDQTEWLKPYRPASVLLRNGAVVDQSSRSVPPQVRRQMREDMDSVADHHGIEEFNTAPEEPKTRAEKATEIVAAMRAEGLDEKQIGLMLAHSVVQGQQVARQQLLRLGQEANEAGDHGLAVGIMEALPVHTKASEEMLSAQSEDYERILTDAAERAKHTGLLATIDNRGARVVADGLSQMAETAGGFTCAGAQSVCITEELAKIEMEDDKVQGS